MPPRPATRRSPDTSRRCEPLESPSCSARTARCWPGPSRRPGTWPSTNWTGELSGSLRVVAAQRGTSTAPRRIEVAPQRLGGWIESFAQRHGGVAEEAGERAVTFLAADGAVAQCLVPSPPLAPGTGPAAERLAAHATADRTVGVLLVRLG